jgi:choline dehydrogenase-like flavoprotein
MTVTQDYDFIIIGGKSIPYPQDQELTIPGGTAGCLLASRLSSNPSLPTIALLESGPAITNPEYRRTFERCSTIFQHASLDYGYMSTPQAGCNGRMVPQNRGLGLGGSSAVNFQVWCLGARSEFERWEDVGEEWGFEEVLRRVRVVSIVLW